VCRASHARGKGGSGNSRPHNCGCVSLTCRLSAADSHLHPGNIFLFPVSLMRARIPACDRPARGVVASLLGGPCSSSTCRGECAMLRVVRPSVLLRVQTLRAIADGADVRGFYYWTLVDNFECECVPLSGSHKCRLLA
jgi:hypothetical protein